MGILNRIVFVFNLIAALGLALSYAAPYVSPKIFWVIPFLGLAYPVLLVVNFLFVIYWLFFGKLKVLLSAIMILAGIGNVGKIVQWSGQNLSDSTHTIKVASFNLGGFGSYTGGNEYDRALRFLEFVNEDKPDVLFLQEFHNVKYNKNKNISDTLKKIYSNKAFSLLGSETDRLAGPVIFSKYPIIKKGIIVGEGSGNGIIYVDIKIKKDTIRCINVHLQSIGLKKELKINRRDLEENQTEALRKSKGIISRLKNAFEMRSEQVDKLFEFLEKTSLRVILAGDFNDTQMSYSYRQTTEFLKDAFVESGSGLGNTYVGPFPSYRIDYIMLSESMQSFNYKTHSSLGSDHKLISSLIRYK